MTPRKEASPQQIGITNYIIIAGILWTLLVLLLAGIVLKEKRSYSLLLATNTARSNIAKDKGVRQWVASHGGVYVPVTETTQPNPYLGQLPERDFKTSSGKVLTLMNPAYVLSQLTSKYTGLYGSTGHLTSLKLLNPKNSPDVWERIQLERFEQGATEARELLELNGEEVLRLMQPIFTTSQCLKCHGQQGYKVGDIRGGISTTLPMEPFRRHEKKSAGVTLLSYGVLWALGLLFISLFIAKFRTVIQQRSRIDRIKKQHQLLKRHHAQQEASKKDLEKALLEIKTLHGIIPICSYCKRIRNDKGAWDIFEAYVCEHSDAQFSHGVCPDCHKKAKNDFK